MLGVLALLLTSCAGAPSPRQAEPDKTQVFTGDYRKMTECLEDYYDSTPATPARVVWRPSENGAEVYSPDGNFLNPVSFSNFAIKEISAGSYVVEMRLYFRAQLAAYWKPIEICAAKIGRP
jgi:hypothetical protein